MTEDFFADVDRLRLSGQQSLTKHERRIKQAPENLGIRRVKGEFVKGPIPLSWLSAAAQLGGKPPLAVALAIIFAVGLKKSMKVALTTDICHRLGVNRKAKYRGLEMLEAAGLIEVHRLPRKNPVVKVINFG